MTKIINSKPFFYVLTLIFSLASIRVSESVSFTIAVWGIFAVFLLYLILIEHLKPLPAPFIIIAVVVTGGKSSLALPLIFLSLPYIMMKLDQIHYLCFAVVSLSVLILTGNLSVPSDFILYILFTVAAIGVWLYHRKDLWEHLLKDKTPEKPVQRKIDENSETIVDDPFKPLKNYLVRTKSFGGIKIEINLIELLPGNKGRRYGSDIKFELRGLIHRVVHDKIELAAKTLLAEQEDVPRMPEYNYRLYYPINMFECGDMALEPEYVLAVDVRIKEGKTEDSTTLKQRLLNEFRDIKDDIVELIRQGEAFRQISIEKLKKENLYIGTSNIVDSFSRDSLFQATALAIFNVIPGTGAVFITEHKNDIHYGHAFKVRDGLQSLDTMKMEHIEEFAKHEIADDKSIHSLMINGKLDDNYELHEINKRKSNPVFTEEAFRDLNKFDNLSSRLITFNNDIKGTITILTRSSEDYEVQKNYTTSRRMINKVASSALNNIEMYEKVEDLSNVDGLTGLYNRRYFQLTLERMLMEASRTGHPLSMIMLDIDHFKRVNDTYGHKAGDDVIRFLARTLKNNIRKVDIAARYGGEEFVVLLHNTNVEGAARLAEKIRILVKDATINADGSTLNITSSFGVSSYPSLSMSTGDLVKNSDQALYYSKENGRNMVAIFSKDIADQVEIDENDDDGEE